MPKPTTKANVLEKYGAVDDAITKEGGVKAKAAHVVANNAVVKANDVDVMANGGSDNDVMPNSMNDENDRFGFSEEDELDVGGNTGDHLANNFAPCDIVAQNQAEGADSNNTGGNEDTFDPTRPPLTQMREDFMRYSSHARGKSAGEFLSCLSNGTPSV